MINENSHGTAPLIGGVKKLYEKGETDYYLSPLVLVDNDSKPVGRIQEGDSVVFCCRRGEREIELTEAFTDPSFGHFPRSLIKDLNFVILTLYHEKFKDLPVAFGPTMIEETLAETVSRAGLSQLHLAESEKYAHVTFFLNGGNNQPFPGEKDVSVPSPKGQPFDQIPELSLPEVTEQAVKGLREKQDFIVVNFANGDVIGHTAHKEAKIRCAAAVDAALEKTLREAEAAGYVTLITADHGNLEELFTTDGSPHMAHTANPVPFIVIDPLDLSGGEPRDGILADIAPTILSTLGIAIPEGMEGKTLLPGRPWKEPRRVLLIILDGWGISGSADTDPISLAQTPFWDDLLLRYPHSRLEASGESVGLQKGKPGNSEAGHLNIGAGRMVPQDDVRLDAALQDGSFHNNRIFIDTILGVKEKNASLHLLSLLTEKSSHGSIDYPLALVKMAREKGLEKVYLHIIFDGRSTPNGSAPALLEKLEQRLREEGIGTVVSGFGRGLALDRDHDYAKIRRVYEALVNGKGEFCRV